MKIKEDLFEVEKNQLKAENQCLEKKIIVMEKDLDSLNLKVSVQTSLELKRISDCRLLIICLTILN